MNERAFHDSRDRAYRNPYGAVEPGTPVVLRIDVWDAPGATVTLRTWEDDAGESRYDMRPSEQPGVHGAQRYEASIAPTTPGVMWYYFIVEEAGGRTWRYGARDGCYGGIGRVCEWEPPSFALAVCGPEDAENILGGIFDGADAMRRAPMDLAVRFLRGELPAPQVVEAWETLRETCSVEVLRRAFDLLGSFSQPRLFALLAGAPDDMTADADLPDYHADPASGGLAKGRLWCACLVQMLAMADPVAYGDMHGGAAEGGNRASAWAPLHEDGDCEDIVRNARELHDALPVFANGRVEFFAVNDDVLGFWRCAADGTSACVLLNASLQNAYDVNVPFIAQAASDVLGGYAVPIVAAQDMRGPRVGTLQTKRYAQPHLYQLGSAVLFFHPEKRLQEPMAAGVGVLAHITSLPVEGTGEPAAGAAAKPATGPGAGTLGAPAHAFVDWLAQAGAGYWQLLPVNPTDEFGSPYAGISAFAGNPNLLHSPAAVLEALPADDLPEYREFCEREGDWLEPYACFMAIRRAQGPNKAWQQWPGEYRHFDPEAIAGDSRLSAFAEECRRTQFAFDRQWRALRARAHERGVKVIGDMPIYVSADSADVWANPKLFQLGPDGRPRLVAGCPPDSFAPEGQVWGNPVYNWDACRRDGYSWWLQRLRRAFDLYDVVRLDHFIGFLRYFCIPADGKAADGVYRPGPGIDFFQAAFREFGPLPIIAEDLGAITPGVRALDAACGFPGMDIVQFADGDDPLSGYRPRPEKVVYTGTHDNQTLRGYLAKRYAHLGADGVEAAAVGLEDVVASCEADVSIFPLQDVLGLGDGARMNTPGTAEGNWTWQARAADIAKAKARLQELVNLHANRVQEGQDGR